MGEGIGSIILTFISNCDVVRKKSKCSLKESRTSASFGAANHCLRLARKRKSALHAKPERKQTTSL